MGSKMSTNEHLLHSMKNLRLSSIDSTTFEDNNSVTIRILEIPSLSSPFRKQTAGKYDVMKDAVNAPLEDDSPTKSYISSIDEVIIDETKHGNFILESAGDTPALHVIRQKNPKFVEIDLIECQKPNDDDDDDNDEDEDKDDD
ncbi:unnamed protein product [Rotaria sp. Silwood1]|nr:unnamed protein product [Rotaria sp. Silwood1]CAF1631771.1 unnamed protein product [Rotaria sp. Silwood1]